MVVFFVFFFKSIASLVSTIPPKAAKRNVETNARLPASGGPPPFFSNKKRGPNGPCGSPKRGGFWAEIFVVQTHTHLGGEKIGREKF